MNFKRYILKKLNIFTDQTRIDWVKDILEKLPSGSSLIDIGCGSQQFRKYCSHLVYFGQDFGQSTTGIGEEKKIYEYGSLDFISDCWDIPVESGKFDYALCTEVLEHVPYPNESIKEISRLLKKGGKFILTIPSHSLRHMDPYWFYPGFSNNWITRILPEHGFQIEKLEAIGGYSTWLVGELFRTITMNRISIFFILPAILYYKFLFPLSKRKNTYDNSLTIGYHVVARKL